MTTTHTEPNYMAIFWWLLGFTILEVLTTRAPFSHLIIAILLVGMALTKAILVAMYFMHLKFERKVLALIAFTPLLLCVFLALMLMPDSKGSRIGRIEKPASAAEAPTPAHAE